LEKLPNLILDLRNNGGGADFAYRAITPYLYTNTIQLVGADVLATDDNITGWGAVATTAGIPSNQQAFIQDLILKMKSDKGKFISLVEDQNINMDSIKHYPQKIAILINGGCGSTTEEFLLQARQSRKVVLMGEHTAGVLDYANVRGADFSCMPYMLYWATSKSRRINQGQGIDNVGIQPDVQLKPEINWIDAAQNYLEKK
jgi:C-terminal processing protease CtpA/Prc